MCDFDEDAPDGARTVGRFDEASPLTRLFVWALRRCMDGVCGRQAVWNHFAERLGLAKGHRAMGALEDLLLAVTRSNRRVLHRHETTCSCIGADEQTLARLVAAAGAGEFEVALAAARAIADPSGAPHIVWAAAELGQLLAKVGDAPLPAIEAAVFPPPDGRADHTVH